MLAAVRASASENRLGMTGHNLAPANPPKGAPPKRRGYNSSSVGRLNVHFQLRLLLCCIGFFAACHDGERALREWKPSDHQPPPAMPDGQGTAAEGGDGTARAIQALWQMRCARCHGEAGRGDGPERPPGAAIPDMTSADFQQNRSDEQLTEVVENGRGLMPAFGDALTPEGISVLVRHVRTLGGR